MKINIIINSYEREEMLIDLLNDIAEIKDHDVYVIVLIDGSKYGKIGESFKQISGLIFHTRHHGKKEYYKLMKTGWELCGNADYYINLPDDVRLKPDFLNKAIEAFESQDCFILDLMNDNRDKQVRERFELVSRVMLQDLCIMYKKNALEWLKSLTFMPPSESRMKLSSGVAKTINTFARLHNKDLYLINEKIVTHGDHESKMNPDRPKIIC